MGLMHRASITRFGSMSIIRNQNTSSPLRSLRRDREYMDPEGRRREVARIRLCFVWEFRGGGKGRGINESILRWRPNALCRTRQTRGINSAEQYEKPSFPSRKPDLFPFWCVRFPASSSLWIIFNFLTNYVFSETDVEELKITSAANEHFDFWLRMRIWV